MRACAHAYSNSQDASRWSLLFGTVEPHLPHRHCLGFVRDDPRRHRGHTTFAPTGRDMRVATTKHVRRTVRPRRAQQTIAGFDLGSPC